MLDEQSGVLTSGADPMVRHSSKTLNVYGAFKGGEYKAVRGANSGGASRFFYQAKASSSERNIGNSNNTHPCVKPINLCRYLATLILPPKRTAPRHILVPFSGSGSEMIGSLEAGWDEPTGIDDDEKWCAISAKRLSQPIQECLLDCEEIYVPFAEPEPEPEPEQMEIGNA